MIYFTKGANSQNIMKGWKYTIRHDVLTSVLITVKDDRVVTNNNTTIVGTLGSCILSWAFSLMKFCVYLVWCVQCCFVVWRQNEKNSKVAKKTSRHFARFHRVESSKNFTYFYTMILWINTEVSRSLHDRICMGESFSNLRAIRQRRERLFIPIIIPSQKNPQQVVGWSCFLWCCLVIENDYLSTPPPTTFIKQSVRQSHYYLFFVIQHLFQILHTCTIDTLSSPKQCPHKPKKSSHHHHHHHEKKDWHCHVKKYPHEKNPSIPLYSK